MKEVTLEPVSKNAAGGIDCMSISPFLGSNGWDIVFPFRNLLLWDIGCLSMSLMLLHEEEEVVEEEASLSLSFEWRSCLLCANRQRTVMMTIRRMPAPAAHTPMIRGDIGGSSW